MPNRKHYRDQENYILDCIDNSGYDNKELPFIEDKLKFLHDTFISEYGWHIQQVGKFEALVSWLQGLPSSINIAFSNHDIIKLCEQWGLLDKDASEARQWVFIESWFRRMAMRIETLWKTHKIGV